MQQEQLRQQHAEVVLKYLVDRSISKESFIGLNDILVKARIDSRVTLKPGMNGDAVRQEMIRVVVDWTRDELGKLKLFELAALVKYIDGENARFGRANTANTVLDHDAGSMRT